MSSEQIQNGAWNIQQSVVQSNKYLFKKGGFFFTFYQLIEGTVKVNIGDSSMNISSPMIIGDYELHQNIQYRASSIRTVTRCTVKQIPISHYFKIKHYHIEITKAMEKLQLKSKMLQYWLSKLLVIGHHKKYQVVGEERSIGIIIDGEFKIDKYIPIVKMKTKDMSLLRKFQICILGPTELFQGKVICETSRGMTGVLKYQLAKSLLQNFEEFIQIIKITQSKKHFHQVLTQNIAKHCKKRKKFFENFVPSVLGNWIDRKDRTNRSNSGQLSLRKQNIQLTKKASTRQDVFRISNNISKFLHKQERRAIKLRVSPKSKHSLNLKQINLQRSLKDFKKSKGRKLSDRQSKSLLPLKFKPKEVQNQQKSRRLKTQQNQSVLPPLQILFQIGKKKLKSLNPQK